MFWKIMDLYCRNFKEVNTAGVLMVSALIVLIGCLKPFVFNKITNKDLRGVLLSLSNVIGAFITVAVTFFVKKINFDYYWFTASVFCKFSVFVYWLYENTKARAGIHKLGKYVLTNVGKVIVNKVEDFSYGTKQIVSSVSSAVKATEKKTSDTLSLKSNSKKDELDELK